MALTIEDLRPKDFTVNVDGVELTCKPLKLSHALTISKLGNIFENAQKASKQEIDNAQKEIYEVIWELIPELKGIELNVSVIMKLIEQIMNQIQPSDNKELIDSKVEFKNNDPKV